MKIGIIAHLKHPIAAPFAGGLEAFTHQITRTLIAYGHEVLLFASSSSDATLPLVPILSDQDYDSRTGIRIKRRDLPSEYIAEHHAYHRLMSEIDSYNLDIVFNNSLHYIPITMANVINTPVLTVLHTPPFYELGLAIHAERTKPVVEYVTVSDQNAVNWKDYIPDCRVIQNGIPLDKWKSYTDPSADRYAVWFGRIHPDKGLHLAIEAAKLAGIKLKVAGRVADQRYFGERIAPILDDSITLLGLQEQPALNKLIGNACVCLVTPCWQEPFGLVVAEALACGTPVAGFKMGALPELITKDIGILVDYPDCYALAAAIHEAMKMDRNLIGSYARTKFELKVMMAQYEDLMTSIIAKTQKSNYTIA
ncbi:probable galactosyltransferase [Pedobacter sp. BAL39]|uniref:glycosyltransferase n=1 Tax=Pedobacter sp. BAL39 TaxID=391596 RepID=UPI0001559D1D|nr:glycosyltransferase [Pedobacter sp. BAL39]EDM35928.1 probable galactosyltransferase [Pedobacter sp. BAL39]